MIKLPGYFTGFSSKADGSASLRFSTQEIPADEFANLKANHNAFGWIIFSPNENEDIPDTEITEEGISASERLRRRMFVYFKEKIHDGDFDTWRKQQLERIGQTYLDKLNN